MKTKLTLFVTVLAAALFGMGCAGVPKPLLDKQSRLDASPKKLNELSFVSSKTLRSPREDQSGASFLDIAWAASGRKYVASYGDTHVWIAEKKSDKLKGFIDLDNAQALSMDWNHDDSRIVMGLDNGIIQILDSSTQETLRTSGARTGKSVSCVSWSPDGKWIAAGMDRSLKIWEGFGKDRTLEGHKGYISEVDWSPNSKKIATCSRDNSIKIWDASTGKILKSLSVKDNPIDVAWSPDGSKVASCGWDFKITIWDTGSWSALKTLRGHKGNVLSISWSPNGKWIASGGVDTTVKIWDVATGGELRTLNGHSDAVDTVRWNPKGDSLMTASRDRTIRIWAVTP